MKPDKSCYTRQIKYIYIYILISINAFMLLLFLQPDGLFYFAVD